MAAAIGTGLLWFGWFGFNAGGALRADYQAVNAFGSTFVALAFAMMTWLILAKIRGNGFDFVDILTGSVAGLATVTPCAGYINPRSAIIIGIIAGIVVSMLLHFVRRKIGMMHLMYGVYMAWVVLLEPSLLGFLLQMLICSLIYTAGSY